MKQVKHRYKLIYLAVILLSTILLGCPQGSDEDYLWVVGSTGIFHTSDLERAQQEIPFTIIVPEYLPDDLDPYSPYLIEGPTKGSSGDKDIEVRVSYKAYGKYSIDITENSELTLMLPNEDFNPIYLDIAGVQVLQQDEHGYGADAIQDGLRFDWNQNGRTYCVKSLSYSEDELAKIVESMIIQMNSYEQEV
jgi:hypothetical protein